MLTRPPLPGSQVPCLRGAGREGELKVQAGQVPRRQGSRPRPRLPAVGSQRCQGSAINVGARLRAERAVGGRRGPRKVGAEGGVRTPGPEPPTRGRPRGGNEAAEPSWDAADPAPLARTGGSRGAGARGTGRGEPGRRLTCRRAGQHGGRLFGLRTRLPAGRRASRLLLPLRLLFLRVRRLVPRPARPEDASRTHSRPVGAARVLPRLLRFVSLRSLPTPSGLAPTPPLPSAPLPSLRPSDPKFGMEAAGPPHSDGRPARAPGSPCPAAWPPLRGAAAWRCHTAK